MEKFSKFNDPSSGINPFLQPKPKSLTLKNYFIFMLYAPLYLLSFIFPSILPLIFTFEINNEKLNKMRVCICNSSSSLDKYVVKYVFRIKNCYYVRDGKFYEFKEEDSQEVQKIQKPCFLFPEGTRTNNRALLDFTVPTRIDLVCFIKYSEVYLYGSFFKYLVSIISNGLTIEIKTKETSEVQTLSKLGNVPVVKFDYKDKYEFMNKLNLYC